jgi:hypothetical protein
MELVGVEYVAGDTVIDMLYVVDGKDCGQQL